MIRAALIAGALGAAAPAPPSLPPLIVPADAPFVDATLAGRPVRLRVAFGLGGGVVLSPAAAAAMGIDVTRPAGTLTVRVGRKEVSVPIWRGTVGWGGASRVTRVAVHASGAVAGADGVASPAALPADIVRVVMRPPASRDHRTTLAAGASDVDGVRGRTVIDGEAVRVAFDPERPVTITTASAGSALAREGDGTLTPEAAEKVEVAYGVFRPVRTVALAHPVAVAGRRLSRFHIRLFDWAGEADLPPETKVDDAILVQRYMEPQQAVPLLTLGADLLGGCAEIAWDRRRGQVELLCPEGAQPAAGR